MKSITFRYADALSNYEWRTQHCTVESVEECIRIYGLGTDCDYDIISVVHEYNGCKVAEICKEMHDKLMKYWTEDFVNNNKPFTYIPIKDVYCYIYKDGEHWDAIYIMETKENGLYLFGEEFIGIDYAIKWLTNYYEDTEELKEEDRKANKN